MKVLVTQAIQEKALDVIRPVAEVIVNKYGRLFTREEFLAELADVDAVLLPWHTDIVDKEAMERAPKLKIAAKIGLGYENIDCKTATEKGIYATYTPVNDPTVADLVFGLAITAARRINESDRFCKGRKWDRGGMYFWESQRGHNIHHRSMGIIGLGRIGTNLARRAKGFDMDICYYDPIRKKETEEELGIKYVSLDELLSTSDFVALVCSSTESSQGLIGKREFGMMKSTTVFVSTVRGEIYDQDALYEALRDKKIFAAGLNGYKIEPIPLDDPILDLDNVVLIPHAGSNTYETTLEMQVVACEDVASVITGKTPKYIVNEEVKKIKPLA